MVNYFKSPKLKVTPHFGFYNMRSLMSYSPVLSAWGAGTFMAIFVFTENWPLFQDTFFKKIPYFGDYWVKEVDPQDVPQ